MTMNGTGQTHTPQRLGDFRLQNSRNGWQLYYRDRLACAGLSTKQALAIVRGELDVDALRRGELARVE